MDAGKFPPRVLIVRPGALGDTILLLPLLESIRERHTDADLTVLGNRAYRDLIPRGIAFHAMDSRDWLWLFRAQTANLGPDARRFDAAYLVLTRPGQVEANLRRAGTETVLHVSSRPSEGTHAVEHLHQGLGLPIPPRDPVPPNFTRHERERVVWIHPGSGGPTKCIPLGWMRYFAESLQDALGWEKVVTIGEEDEFLRRSPEWQKLVDAPRTRVLGRMPLAELCGILGNAGLFVGNDSGIAHLAASLGVPAAVFFVTTDPVQWAPWVPETRLRVTDLRGVNLSYGTLRREAEALVRWASAVSKQETTRHRR